MKYKKKHIPNCVSSFAFAMEKGACDIAGAHTQEIRKRKSKGNKSESDERK